jgi:putative membrane protein
MLWVKAFHIVFMVTWFAGLFYLPRLFVYHALAEDRISIERFKVMERKLYFGIMAPGATLTVAFGLWLLWLLGRDWLRSSPWIHLKLACVAVLIAYHVYLGVLRRDFAAERNRHGHVFYRWLNEFPVIILLAVVLLAVLKPAL